MKNIVLLFSLVCSLNSWAIESINAVIGDTSYLVNMVHFRQQIPIIASAS
ncbi:hypothetical protein N9Y60_00070 [Crocinitomicaceae bacterium]|nr:hypothetical protein [Crocinitomicaceae bacterium]